MLFGIPEVKDRYGSGNYDEDGVVPQAIRVIKDAAPDLMVISDMCFCEYTDHGHCGVVNFPDEPAHCAGLHDGYLLNDPTLELLARASVVHAQAGADIIAPSGMIDGMVGAIRAALDQAGLRAHRHHELRGQVRQRLLRPVPRRRREPAAVRRPQRVPDGPGNVREAMKETRLDVEEGADILMVKPALPYLDVLSAVRRTFDLPVAAYQVSGEYAMLQAAAANGWLDLRRCALESLSSIKRAGADMIITYFAKDAVGWLG